MSAKLFVDWPGILSYCTLHYENMQMASTMKILYRYDHELLEHTPNTVETNPGYFPVSVCIWCLGTLYLSSVCVCMCPCVCMCMCRCVCVSGCVCFPQEMTEHYLVLFSFHLLILSLDHSRHDFIYGGMLPLSGLSSQVLSLYHNTSNSFVFQISGEAHDSSQSHTAEKS